MYIFYYNWTGHGAIHVATNSQTAPTWFAGECQWLVPGTYEGD